MADLAQVKRNIQRMIDQNAPEADIDAYVASEGTTPEELRSAASALPTQEGGGVGLKPFHPALIKRVEMLARLGSDIERSEEIVRRGS